MRLLLDIAVFRWRVTGSEPVPGAIRKTVSTPENEVWLSAVSSWEIAVKHRLGRPPPARRSKNRA